MTTSQQPDTYLGVLPGSASTPHMTALRYFEAGRRLRPLQALHWIFRRSIGRRYRVPLAQEVQLRGGVALATLAPMAPSGLADNEFIFLNCRHRFPGRIDWHISPFSRLWCYNLHYFDYALDPSRNTAWVIETMRHWIATVPPRKSTGWEPYPASLRIVNWIKFALTRDHGVAHDHAWQASLYQQVAWLERNLEHEIQANHLLKNVKALIFGGVYFSGAAPDRWLRKGLRLMLNEARDQFLADGGHYERSAMYHAIALEDLLDVIALAQSSPGLLDNQSMKQFLGIARAAVHYLNDITYPQGTPPMFNDSVPGIASDAAILWEYAQRLLPTGDALSAPPATDLIAKQETGYYGYRHNDEMLLIDAGSIGPSYQPGHGHCDLLSFELIVGGRPVVVDSGVFDYEDTALRQVLRRTAAHNTVRIDQMEQSDVWGCFRVGRRAEPGSVDVLADLPIEFRFRGSHDGYRHLRGQPVHRRTLDCRPGRSWRVTDDILGTGRHQLESFIHFHPDLTLQRADDAWLLINAEGHALYRVSLAGGDGEMLHTDYCPGFGIRRRNTSLCLSVSADLPHSFGYLLEVI